MQDMFSWGEQCRRGFRLKDGKYVSSHSGDGVLFLDLGFTFTHLSAGLRALSFVKSNGNAFIIRVHESKDGTRVRGKQKCVQWKEKVRAVSCQDDVVVLLSETGQVLCLDTTHPHLKPSPLKALGSLAVAQVSCGSQHSIVLTQDGQVFTWGLDSRGQLGLGKGMPETTCPQQVRSVSDLPLVQVAAGGEQSFGLSVSGSVFSWGSNSCGQLGLGDTTDRHTPTLVYYLNMKRSCHISCGQTHTAVLTKDGAVFTFGSGRHGQLGHNSFRDEVRPRLVAELWGSKVTAVACGREHTVVLTQSQKMYSFGCGAEGQLGHGDHSHPSVPLPVQLPQDHSGRPNIRNIFAGGNCSFATCPPQDDDDTESKTSEAHPTLDILLNRWTSDSAPWKQTQKEIQKTLSSASCLNRSFLDPKKHFATSTKQCGLDLSAAQSSFSKLLNEPRVLEAVEAEVMRLLRSLDKSPLGVEALRIYLLLPEFLHVLQDKNKVCSALATALAASVLRLSEDNLQVLGDWWSSLSYSTRVRHVEVWKNTAKATPILPFRKSLLRVLQHQYNINSKTTGPQRIPDSVFCTPVPLDMIIETVQWHLETNKAKRGEPPTLCSFPFLMDLKTRQYALILNNRITMQKKIMDDQTVFCLNEGEFEDEFISEFLTQGVFGRWFTLKLRRESVMVDSFRQLSVADVRDFKRPLVVFFNGFKVFDNVNQKDFFHRVFHEMVSAESGMFMFNDSSTLAWFSSKATRPREDYFLFGVLCGLALFHTHIIFLPFPLALFKKLLGVKPSLDDLCELSPCIGKGLRCLLEEYSDDVIEGLDMDFQIHWDRTDIDLDPNSPRRPVTGQNKREFVEAYVNHVFNSSVDGVFEEFRRGFFQACDLHVVELFTPEELRGLMAGQEFNDWARFKQSTVYKGIYHVNHPTILMFWEVFEEMTEEQKKALLWFVTGFERVPIVSKQQQKMMTVQGLTERNKELPDDCYFPKSHTCYSVLELPLYSTKDIMKNKLTEALAQISPSHDETLAHLLLTDL